LVADFPFDRAWLGAIMRLNVGGGLAIGLVAALGACTIDDEDRPALGEEGAEIRGGVDTPAGMYSAVGDIDGCTATLVAPDVVLTAAHCVCHSWGCDARRNFKLTDVFPVGGTTRTAIDVWGDVVTHPLYGTYGWLRHDYALIMLDRPITELAQVTPMDVETQRLPRIDERLTLVGFGPCQQPDDIKRHGVLPVKVVEDQGGGSWNIGFIDRNTSVCHGDSGGPAIDAAGRVIGVSSQFNDFDDAGYDATMVIGDWLRSYGVGLGHQTRIWDVADGAAPAEQAYRDLERDLLLAGWTGSEDVQLVGDFMATGDDQLLFINRGAGAGRVLVVDHREGGIAVPMYWENYGQHTLLNGWTDPGDVAIAGDFMGRGYDQVLFINRGAGVGRVMIVDFRDGAVPAELHYLERYADGPWLVGWHDANDVILAGDFRHAGHDQVMFINRSGVDGRVLIVDFSDGAVPAEWQYYERYSAGPWLNGWHDPEDAIVAGDFRGFGHDQVMFINRGPGSGRVLITDFSDGAVPAEWQYIEAKGQSSALDGWHDAEDVVVAGRFFAAGRDQVMFVNRSSAGSGAFKVADFSDGALPAETAYYEPRGAQPDLGGRLGASDIVVIGNFLGRGQDQLVTIER
jgi:V8-like Glu-specific endopeptidase